jgi:hypothetical protein
LIPYFTFHNPNHFGLNLILIHSHSDSDSDSDSDSYSDNSNSNNNCFNKLRRKKKYDYSARTGMPYRQYHLTTCEIFLKLKMSQSLIEINHSQYSIVQFDSSNKSDLSYR